MALTVNFSCSQQVGAPQDIDFDDTSTGTDVAVVSRRIYIRNSAGEFLVEEGTTTEYETWSGFPGTTTITLTVLSADVAGTATTITVQWLNVSNVVLYDKTATFGFTLDGETFDYGLTQNLAQNSALSTDNNYLPNKSKFRTYLDSGNQAISLNSDIYAAQICYNKATEMMGNSQYYFNTNA